MRVRLCRWSKPCSRWASLLSLLVGSSEWSHMLLSRQRTMSHSEPSCCRQRCRQESSRAQKSSRAACPREVSGAYALQNNVLAMPVPCCRSTALMSRPCCCRVGAAVVAQAECTMTAASLRGAPVGAGPGGHRRVKGWLVGSVALGGLCGSVTAKTWTPRDCKTPTKPSNSSCRLPWRLNRPLQFSNAQLVVSGATLAALRCVTPVPPPAGAPQPAGVLWPTCPGARPARPQVPKRWTQPGTKNHSTCRARLVQLSCPGLQGG